jgi:ABC-type glycerol-3-phosphate transport system substrate-binding protein
MMKMKKFVCLLLSLSFTLFFVAACGNEEAAAPEDEVKEEAQAKDMFGYEFIFKAFVDYETFFFPEAVQTEYGDKILARYDETSKHFNCNVNVSVIEGDTKTALVAAAAIGEKYADLLDTQAKVIYDSIDYFMPLSQMPGMDIADTKWGPASYLDTAKFNGENYGFMAYDWGIPYPQYIGNLFYMPSVMEEFSLASPQELYEQKSWTWDKFKEYCTKMTVKGATPEEDRYGFVISDEMKFPRAFIISNGGNAIEFVEEQNKYVYGLNDPKAQQALQYIKDMLDQGIGYYTTGDGWEKAAKMFKEKRTGFYEAFNKMCFINAPLHLANDLGEPYAWVPYPVGPSGTFGKSTAQFWFTARFLGLPNNNLDDEELENNSLILNYMFEPLEGETKDSWKDRVKRQYFFDDQSFEYYIDLFEGGTTDFSAVAYQSVWTDIPNVYRSIISGKKAVGEATLGIADKVNAEVDKLINPYVE